MLDPDVSDTMACRGEGAELLASLAASENLDDEFGWHGYEPHGSCHSGQL
jgi:hypothetical protein